MTDISRRFEQLVKDYYKKNHTILPVKTSEGIAIGDLLVKNRGCLKDIYKKGELVYPNINLNEAAIKIVNAMASGRLSDNICHEIYRSDQDYGKWLNDWQHFKNQKTKMKNLNDFDRLELLNMRIAESKLRAEQAKKRVMSL